MNHLDKKKKRERKKERTKERKRNPYSFAGFRVCDELFGATYVEPVSAYTFSSTFPSSSLVMHILYPQVISFGAYVSQQCMHNAAYFRKKEKNQTLYECIFLNRSHTAFVLAADLSSSLGIGICISYLLWRRH